MQSAHIRDVVSAMKIAANIYDEIAWRRYLQLWDGIGDVKASKIIADLIHLENLDKMIARLSSSNLKGIVPEIPATLEAVKNFVNHPSKALKEALFHMEKLMERSYKEEWHLRKQDFAVLEEVAKATGSISEFITEYVLDPKAETTLKHVVKPQEDTVILSTIHSAKGLEAKTVHVTNVNPFNYPLSKTIQQGEAAVEEERRCLYVALTRAKDKLNLYRFTRSLHTQYDDSENKEAALYFLNNLPSKLVTTMLDGEKQKELPKIGFNISRIAEFPDFDFD
jgi:DNA helicase-2/ATP-dependent DNA helicase PcrA